MLKYNIYEYQIALMKGGVFMWYIWLIAAGIFFVAEIMTVGFMIFWLGVSALITCIVSLFTSNLIIQTSVFVILSALLLLLTRPFVEKFIIKKDDKVVTNAYSIIGKEAEVIKAFDKSTKIGQIRVDSEVWTAKCENDELLNEGEKVEVLAIDGVKAIVNKI